MLNKAVAGVLASLYNSISGNINDRDVLTQVLQRLCSVAKFNQQRVRNAVHRSLPVIDQKLGERIVVEAVLDAYRKIENEQALQGFLKAALRVKSFQIKDVQFLLKDDKLPDSIRGVLVAEKTLR